MKKIVNLQLVEAEKKEGFRAGLPQHGACNDKIKHTPIFHGDLFKVEGGARDDKVKRTPILHGDLFKVEGSKKPVRKLL